MNSQFSVLIPKKAKKVIKTTSTGKDTLARSTIQEGGGDEDRNSPLQKIELDLEQNGMFSMVLLQPIQL
jgi:hypothetical protein